MTPLDVSQIVNPRALPHASVGVSKRAPLPNRQLRKSFPLPGVAVMHPREREEEAPPCVGLFFVCLVYRQYAPWVPVHLENWARGRVWRVMRDKPSLSRVRKRARFGSFIRIVYCMYWYGTQYNRQQTPSRQHRRLVALAFREATHPVAGVC